MGGGVGVAEAAGVRGGAHIDGLGNAFVQGAVHQGQHIIHDLRAAGADGVHQFKIREAGGAAVVVDAELNPPQQRLESLLEDARRGHVHAQYAVGVRRRVGGEPLMEPPEPGADLFVFQHVSGFAQLPQSQAEGGGGADGVPVGTGVG